jgi:hypothetical protein
LGLLLDAQSRAFDCGSSVGRWPASWHRRGSSALYAADQLPREMARLSMARAFCFIRDGRALLAGGRAIHRDESRASETRVQSKTVALEQRRRTPVGPRRPTGASRSDAGDGRRLARPAEKCNPGRGATEHTRAWSHRLSIRRRHVCGTPGAIHRSHPTSKKIRPPVQITQTTIIGSCPRNSRNSGNQQSRRNRKRQSNRRNCLSRQKKKAADNSGQRLASRAGDGARTRDVQLGKLALYH